MKVVRNSHFMIHCYLLFFKLLELYVSPDPHRLGECVPLGSGKIIRISSRETKTNLFFIFHSTSLIKIQASLLLRSNSITRNSKCSAGWSDQDGFPITSLFYS